MTPVPSQPSFARSCAAIYIDNGFPLDFLRYLFPPDPETGHYVVSSTNTVGGMLTYLAQPSLTPAYLPDKQGRTVCVLDLPAVDALPRGQWMQYGRDDMVRINHVLSDCFELDFYRYFLKGVQYGYEKKEIVETYVLSRNLVTGEPFDTLHKRVFRKEMDIMKHKVEQLRRKAKYFFDESDTNSIQPR